MVAAVRLALPREASQIAAIQRRSWGEDLPREAAEQALAEVDLDAAAASWEAAIIRPPLAQQRVLAAVEDNRVTGFAAIGPSDDPDAEAGVDALVVEFVVDPPARRRGHGSRLLTAVADTLRADGFGRATWWVLPSDDALRRFLDTAGWAPDGSHRVVGTESGARLKLVRMHTDISPT